MSSNYWPEASGRMTVELPPMGNLTLEQKAQKSLTHWIWHPYKDINNMGPFGLNSQLGYRDQRWTIIKRCTPYPLGNLTSTETDRAAMAEIHASGFSPGANALPVTETVKYAQEQAAELGQIYADDYGLRVLTPLIGEDDSERVLQIIQVVQPFEYAIHEMAFEFTEGATKRIEKSNLSSNNQESASKIAKIMLNGAVKAEVKALSEYETLIQSMSEASVGKPGISNPNKFHEWICLQLNKEVPARINRTQTQGSNNDAINILAKRALQEESAAESMSAQLAEEKEARKALEIRLAALEEKPKEPTKGKSISA